MGLSIILTTLTSPDLCADVYVNENGVPYTDALGQTWSRFCESTSWGFRELARPAEYPELAT
jgi:hypothetical protein